MVVRDFSASLFLGADYLPQVKAVIDFGRNVLVIPGVRDIAENETDGSKTGQDDEARVGIPAAHFLVSLRTDPAFRL